MIGSLVATQPAQSRGTTYDGLSGHFFIILLLLLKLLRASQNLL